MQFPKTLRLLSYALLQGVTGAALVTALTVGSAGAQINLTPAANPQRPAQDNATQPGGPTVLRQPGAANEAQPTTSTPPANEVLPPYLPGEFEVYVQRQLPGSQLVRRLGAELLTGTPAADTSPLVPADYVVASGDEVLVTIWGSVDADLRLTVDRAGRISIPRVGLVQVAGVRHADLTGVIERRVAQVFRSFQLSASLGQLRGVRVFVTGFAVRPGAYTVSSLSTAVAALMRAGGPSAAGSFRRIELRRGAELVARLDLYDLLLKGDRSLDPHLQAGDVVHVAPVGPQVGVIGSFNRPAIVELREGETVADAMVMVGGFSAVADRSRLALERLQDRQSTRVAQLNLPADGRMALADGDVVRAFSAVTAQLPVERQAKRVRVEGEVLRPGDFVLPEGSTLADALRAAGGLTPNAYVFASEFYRESTRQQQKDNYDRALRDLETGLARQSGSQRVASSALDQQTQAAQDQAAQKLFERLRALEPTGRIVFQLPADARELPNLVLEEGDRLLVPARSTTVGVFGSVFNAGSYLHSPERTLADYLRLAGGPTKGADDGSIFVIRANGNVVSNRQGGGWFDRSNVVSVLKAEPGDTVFVPEEMDKTTFVQAAKDWTQILYQFGIGIAGIKSAVR